MSNLSSCCSLSKLDNQNESYNSFVLVPHRIGNMILLLGKKSTVYPYQLLVGPEWYCMSITYLLILVPTIFFLINIASLYNNPAVSIIGSLSLISLILAFSATACSDPGIVFVDDTSDEENIKNATYMANRIECSICKIYRPRTASHCYECGVCVEELDHHCPWTGKCIGKKNIRFFYAFLSLLCFHILFIVAAVIYSIAEKKDIFP